MDAQTQPKEPAKGTQKAVILHHLRKLGSISQHQAFTDYGYTRLAARIHDLKGLGYNIKGVLKTNLATGVRYKRYFLEPNL